MQLGILFSYQTSHSVVNYIASTKKNFSLYRVTDGDSEGGLITVRWRASCIHLHTGDVGAVEHIHANVKLHLAV